MTVDEYLHTSFEDGECEFLDGQVVERNTGEWLHGLTLATMTGLLGEIAAARGLVFSPSSGFDSRRCVSASRILLCGGMKMWAATVSQRCRRFLPSKFCHHGTE
jgi:hypothetical protein